MTYKKPCLLDLYREIADIFVQKYFFFLNEYLSVQTLLC